VTFKKDTILKPAVIKFTFKKKMALQKKKF
jgi:hypothetical protein